MPSVVKTAQMTEVAESAEVIMKAELVQMTEKSTKVEDKKVAKEEVAAPMEEVEVAAAVMMETMGVVAMEVAVKEAKEGEEEENQEVMVENPQEEEVTQWKCLNLVPIPCLILAVASPFQKNH